MGAGTPQAKEKEDPQFQVDMKYDWTASSGPSVEPAHHGGWTDDGCKPRLYPNLEKEFQNTDYYSMVLSTQKSMPDAVQCVLDINKVC